MRCCSAMSAPSSPDSADGRAELDGAAADQGGPLAVLLRVLGRRQAGIDFFWMARMAARAGARRDLSAAAGGCRGAKIVAGRKWNNLKVVGIVSLLAAANIAFHVEAHLAGLAEYSMRAGVALVVTLVCVIGGRIVPSFTRNWLARRKPGRLPVAFNRFDAIVMAAGVCAMIAWVLAPAVG